MKSTFFFKNASSMGSCVVMIHETTAATSDDECRRCMNIAEDAMLQMAIFRLVLPVLFFVTVENVVEQVIRQFGGEKAY